MQFKKLDLETIRTLHLFLPIVSQVEPDTFLFIDWLQQRHPEIRLIVPKADFESGLLTHYEYPGRSGLSLSAYQIPEPAEGVVFEGTPDLVLVPLIAFDRRGYRVGYGKGFYDRFLQELPAKKIGLSFFEALDEINDVHLKDIRLDMCLTPKTIMNFKP